MSLVGKTSNNNVVLFLCGLGLVITLSVIIFLQTVEASVYQYFASGAIFLTFGMLICLLWPSKDKSDADSDEDSDDAKPVAVKNDAAKETASTDSHQETITKLANHIRTPLSSILSVANVISESFNPDNKKQYVDSLVASVETITDIVDIISGESGGKLFGIDINDNIRTFDLRKLITQTAELTPGVELKLEVYGDLPRLKGNSVKMRRILLSIFDFFLQYTPKDSLPAQVTVVVNRVRIPITPIKYRFDVKSQFGIGLDTEAEITELNIAKRLIEELGGNIKRRFEDDCTFIYFNVCFDDEEKSDTEIAQPNAEMFTNETAGFTALGRAKTLDEANIIVCDDNPINQKVMSLSLDKHVRSIALASNGQECVELVSRGRYDLILMDIQMPVLDGYEATIQIRKRERDRNGAHLPIIAVTANTMSGDRQHCLEIGMDDYISKPFQIEDVIRKMKEQLTKHPMR